VAGAEILTYVKASPLGLGGVAPLDRCEVANVEPERVAAVHARLPDERTTQDLAEAFRVLADPGRVSLILALFEAGELWVCDLAAAAGLSQTACSNSLRLLRSSRRVRYRKRDGTSTTRSTMRTSGCCSTSRSST
jgi:hypothetical protein